MKKGEKKACENEDRERKKNNDNERKKKQCARRVCERMRIKQLGFHCIRVVENIKTKMTS